MKNWLVKNWILVTVVIIILIVIYYQMSKPKNPLSAAKPNPNASPLATNSAVFPLKVGSSGPEVLNVQKYFNANNSCGLKVDGFYGKDTENCVNDIWGVTEIDENSYKNRILIDNSITDSLSLAQQVNQALTGFFSGF